MVLTAQIAAIYAAILIPFKVGIPLIPGFAELRPANAIPVVASVMFGPAAAWGSAIGNVIGDCFGTIGPASVFGFLGNFLFGYVPHLLWGNMGWLSSGREPLVQSWRQGMEFVIVCLVASLACAAMIGWGVEWLGFLPFAVLAPAIFLNNVVMGVALGPPLLSFLYPRVKAWGLRYQDFLIDEGDMSEQKWDDVPPGDSKTRTTKVDGLDDRPVIEIQNMSFRYARASTPTIQGLTVSFDSGHSTVIMGRGGSGKSTLCFALNGLIPQFVKGELIGTIRVNGYDTTCQPVWQQAHRVGIVFQDFDTQLVSTNVETELRHALACGEAGEGQATDDGDSRVHMMLRLVGLTGMERRDPLTLSGGQRQRLVMGAALIRQPRVLVLDQPLTDLDPAGRKEFLQVLSHLQANGMMLVWVEHECEDVLSVERVCLLDGGQMAWQGSMRDFIRQPALAKKYGIRPFDLARCFESLGMPSLPSSIDEAWSLADQFRLKMDPPPDLFHQNDHCRPGHGDRHSGSVLRLENVSYVYADGYHAIRNITVEIGEGEFVAILGQNGSGKTTLSKLLNGLFVPTEGNVMVGQYDTARAGIAQLAGVVGYVFQNPDHQIFAETVQEEVAFGAKNVGCDEPECARRVAEALEAVGLAGTEADDPFSLTKGERQRVAVASVLAAKPNILIFDEPTTGLDAEESERMMGMIQRLNQDGHTIIMITHGMWIAAHYARRGLLMKGGELLADGSIRSLFADPELVSCAGLELPAITRFSQRWGHTLLTVDEVRASLKPS